MHSDTPRTSCALGTSLGGIGGISQQPGNPRGEGKPGKLLALPGPQGRGLPLDGLAEILNTSALSRKSIFKSHCLGNRTVAGLAPQAPRREGGSVQRAGQTQTPKLGQDGTCTCSHLLGGHQGPCGVSLCSLCLMSALEQTAELASL